MIRGVTINNFRGFEAISISDMSRMTLISGRNNVGKSSILEALFLMMDHTSNDSFAKINGFRGLFPPICIRMKTARQGNLDRRRRESKPLQMGEFPSAAGG